MSAIAATPEAPTLQRVSLATVALAEADGCGVCLLSGQRLEPVFATDKLIDRLQDLQVLTGQGPAIAAMIELHPVLIEDLELVEVTRWPLFTHAALSLGARAAYVVALRTNDITLGS